MLYRYIWFHAVCKIRNSAGRYRIYFSLNDRLRTPGGLDDGGGLDLLFSPVNSPVSFLFTGIVEIAGAISGYDFEFQISV